MEGDVWICFCLALLIVTKFEGISAQIRYSIQEELKEGTGVNGEIEYSLRSKIRGLSSEPFELDSKTGKLTVKGRLDYEEKQVYEIKVLAADKGAVSLSTHCNVVVRVEDVNDNQPEIDITSLSSRIPEDAPPGTVVALMVSATDADGGENAAVTYSLDRKSPGPSITSFLNINEANGTLSALKSFDFETLKTFHFQVVATDSGVPSLSSNICSWWFCRFSYCSDIQACVLN
uniref:Cadherin domain-containing protein n=1 Tax=Amphiprion percula TaxID=161767 RepID=A0A3P8TBJ0_AMPPE